MTRDELADRNAVIWREFDGRNYRQLAARFGISVRHIRRIIEARRHATLRCRRQNVMDRRRVRRRRF